MNEPSRRNFLKMGSSGVAVGLATVAGCLSRASDSGAQTTEASVPAPSDPAYRRWLPDPGSVGPTDHDHYRARYYSLAELREYPEQKLSTFHRRRIRDEIGFLGVVDSADELLRLSGVGAMQAHVVRGRYDTDEVLRTVRENGFSHVENVGEYRVLRRNGPSRAVAVADSAVLYAKRDDAVELVEAIVDATRGHRPRYHEVDNTFASLSEAVGESTVTVVETTEPAPQSNPEILRFEGSVGHATGRTLADGTEYVRHAIEFTGPADAHVETVRETVSDDSSFATVDVFADRGTVVVEGELDPSS